MTVHIGQLRGDLLVVVVAQVRHQHDVAHALALLRSSMAFWAAFASSWNWVVASGRDELAVLAAMVTPDADHAVDLLDGVGLQVGGGADQGQRRLRPAARCWPTRWASCSCHRWPGRPGHPGSP